jgi:hypothetical protein
MAIAEVARDPHFARGVAEATGYVPRSILAVPLETERETLGVIEVLDAGAGAPAEAQGMELLVLLARQTALAIEGARVFEALGRALFAAAAASNTSTSVSESLLEMARSMDGPHAGVVELAGHLSELGRFGQAEQLAATAIIKELVTYVKSRATVQ